MRRPVFLFILFKKVLFSYKIFIMNNIVAYSHILNGSGVKTIPLREGNTVLVRIIADKGNGQYEGSVAGNRVTINSSKAYAPGSTFLATISMKDGRPFLSNIESKDVNQIFQKFNVTSFVNVQGNALATVADPSLAAYLNSLGLAADNLSYHLLQQMKSLGLKFDSFYMNRVYKMAARFSGKEKSAASLILLLKQKGIDASFEDIEALLNNLDEDSENNNFNQKETQIKSDSSIQNETLYFETIIKKFFEDLMNLNEEKTGLLTVMNHLRASKSSVSDSSWIFLPYELICNEEKTGGGNIKLLLNNNNQLEMVCLSCLYQNEKSDFVINYLNHKINKIAMYKDNTADIDKEIKLLKDKLKILNSDVIVEWIEKEKAEGLCASFDDIQKVQGDVL